MKRRKLMTWLLISAMAAGSVYPGATAAYAEDAAPVASGDAAESAAADSAEGASGVSDYEDQGDRDFGEDPASEIVSEDDAAAGTVDSGTGDADGPSSLIEDTDGGAGLEILRISSMRIPPGRRMPTWPGRAGHRSEDKSL